MDGAVVPRQWFGCCSREGQCQSKDAWTQPRCHQYSSTLSGGEILTAVGSNISVVQAPKRFDRLDKSALAAPLRHSNQLDQDKASERHLFLYATDLPLNKLNDRKILSKWSKRQHTLGIRILRLIPPPPTNNLSSTTLPSIKGLQLLFDRHFLLDIAFLNTAQRMMVLDVAKMRRKPVLHSRAFLSSNHACGNEAVSDEVSEALACAIASVGGLLLIGAQKPLVGPEKSQCTTIEQVDAYLIRQIRRFEAISCGDGKPNLALSRHLGLASNLPLMASRAEEATDGRSQTSRWSSFAVEFVDRMPDTAALSALLGLNWMRVIRAALPGVRSALPVFPIEEKKLSSDKAVQFQWRKPIVNNPRHLPGSVFGMRRHRVEIELRDGKYFSPYLNRKVVMGNKKTLQIPEGYYRWRVISSNRSGQVASDWAHFSIVPPPSSL